MILKKIIRNLEILVYDPYVIYMKIIAKIKKKFLPLPEFGFKTIRDVKIEFDFNMAPMIKNMYYGDYEIETIRIMQKYLKKGDTFIDAGANVGYLSAIALGIVGKEGQVHSFEPVPKYFAKLKNLAHINSEFKIFANQFALGDKEGKSTIAVPYLPHIGLSTMVPGSLAEPIERVIEIDVCRLDDYIVKKGILDVKLIKIDVEGYEFPVLKGLRNYFERSTYRPVIICEIAPDAYYRLEYTLSQLAEYMIKYGYKPHKITNSETIDIAKLKKLTYIVFLHF